MIVAVEAVDSGRPRVLWRRLLIGAAVVVVMGAAAQLLGWNVRGWLGDVWDTITGISAGYLAAGVFLATAQTTLTAFAWYSILRFAYPGRVRLLDVVACYAASVALNGVLPANLGTLALLVMFPAIIAGATFTAVLGAYAVEKIFFVVIGAFTYAYLFLSVGGSFDLKFSFIREHPWATTIFFVGGGYLIFLLVRRGWGRVLAWWENAKDGGAILGKPRKYLARVFAPSLLAWVASLGLMAVFLSAYDIPVSFHTVMRIMGGNSLANVTSVTPGGAGVNQAFNVASLKGVASPQDATAYSVAQQLITTSWNILFGIAMLVWAFGWSGGKKLVRDSYEGAKEKTLEQKASRDAKKAAKREARPVASR